ncbi:MAG: HEAT repeat domain-containing protein [bacterium]
MDDAIFEREPGRRELPQERWYVIRNSIYVLGRLQDRTGVIPLRLRISDPDVRVRREIVSALESIGGEESCDLLVVMADDPDFEIAESAIIAAGLVGDEDMAPLVADVAARRPALATRTASALGQIGGAQARRCLSRWLSDADAFEKVTRGGVSRDDLRLAIVKALGRIGDKEALDRIRQLKKSLSLTHKLLPRSALLSRTIDEILSRQ